MNGELQAALEHRINHGTSWMGVPARKQPIDAWVYQEIIWEIRPDWIVEIGNKHGGSLLYLTHLCDLIGHGRLIGVDNNRDPFEPLIAEHSRVTLVTGDALEMFPDVAVRVFGTVLVIEDSAHTYGHTLDVLRMYGSIVTVGSYLICEDGVMDPVRDALAQFAAEQDDLVADPLREWPITWNPGGYLKKVK